MQIFSCTRCSNAVHFENCSCESCGSRLGYRAKNNAMSAVRDGQPDDAADGDRGLRFCANAASEACNWLIEPEEPGEYCRACRHNGVIPNLVATPGNIWNWRRIEEAKRRLFYSLLRWNLPSPTRAEDPDGGLRFEFLADLPDRPKVMTGHDDGLITISLAEADDVERERRRTAMGEPYRTLIGHFRHEIGHFYWNVLVRDSARLEACRAVFGDDRIDYGEALERHHRSGPPQDWRAEFVSSYATMHPWEDFAESFAHYMHIVDTLETASAFGVSVRPRNGGIERPVADRDFDPYEASSFDDIAAAWVPVVLAMNAINRSMGLPDLYPFILTSSVMRKLAFIHSLVRGATAAT